jgi:LysR family glycine cleavage system transcriptional activator
MAGDLPSIDALRAFVEAARASSFKRAAEVLHLSPSAKSRQNQGLEQHHGAALNERRKPGHELTEAGAR